MQIVITITFKPNSNHSTDTAMTLILRRNLHELPFKKK
ncbi:hypothetical protein SAMN05444682_10135 [Parapedobacter indicus]|uniref:Uncharacterized protein n=1 Tax=Parapedobacter indicus TaxID=1477437 RepID=A0A1I3CH59_9SPHI|nr:hypothetical protein CLV26_10148 [Parapedobacter indicus]SFH73795.1 hypothetical protein SAMN05444682_10135 [Parapedobacter indicus]